MTTPTRNPTRFARRANSRVAYDPGAGTPSGAASSPIVLLHDLLGDRTSWALIREELQRESRVMTPEARGHGASSTLVNQWYTIGELALDIEAILNAEDLSCVHLLGYGLGAVTALELAQRSPNRVSSVTVIEPPAVVFAAGTRNEVARGERDVQRASDREAADSAYKGLTDRALDTYWRSRFDANWQQHFTQHEARAMRRHAPALAALLPALDTYAVDLSVSPDLREKTMVVLAPSTSALDDAARERLEAIARRTIIVANPINLANPASADELVGHIRAHLTSVSR